MCDGPVAAGQEAKVVGLFRLLLKPRELNKPR